MRFQNILFILIITIPFAGCSSCSEESPNNSKNTETAVSNTANINNQNTNINGNSNTNSQTNDTLLTDLKPVEKPKEQVPAVTLKPIVMAYCDAMNKKDNAALRKVYSQAALKRLEAKAQSEGASSLVEYLELESPGNKCEVVNETVQGNNAEAYVITEAYPEGTAFRFVNENNEWKMTDESADIDRVKKK